MGYLLLDTLKYLYKGSTNNVVVDSNENLVANQFIGKANHKKMKQITSDYTIDVDNDEVLMVVTTAGDVTITLPEKSTITNDGLIRKFTITKATEDSNIVIITTSGTDTYPLGNTNCILSQVGEVIDLGGSYNGWGKQSMMKVSTLTRRTSTWAASNFAGVYTSVPFEQVDLQDNPQIFSWNISNPTRITCGVTTRLNCSYKIDINSTGGSTWNLFGRVIKNGTTVIDYFDSFTGNYGGEDGTLVTPPFFINVEPGDYLEFQIGHNNLTGVVQNAVFNVDSLL